MVILSSFLFSGCDKKQGCTDPLAENYDPSAEIENATCITQRQKFLGLYDAQEQCIITNTNAFFSEVRKANDNLTDILIFNFNNTYINPVRATVNRTTFVIDRQDPDGTGHAIQGEGSIQGNIITIQYKIRINAVVNNDCIVNMTK